jgi:hypothetical protein
MIAYVRTWAEVVHPIAAHRFSVVENTRKFIAGRRDATKAR